VVLQVCLEANLVNGLARQMAGQPFLFYSKEIIMRSITTNKIVPLIQPFVAAASTAYTGTVDTKGYDFCNIVLSNGPTIHAAYSLCAVSECDTSGGTFALIDALTLGNAAAKDIEGNAAALSDTDDNDTVVFQIDCNESRQRFQRINILTAAGGNSIFTVFAVLGRVSDMGPDNNANACAALTGTSIVLRS